MVKNREELLRVAQENAAQLKAHLRGGIIDFIEAQKTNVDELAYALGVATEELVEIIEGEGNVTLDTLSKLLVATDNVVEIKPIGASPMGAYMPGMPQSGGYPGIPTDRNGRPIPPPPGFMPPMGMQPAPFGRRPFGRAGQQPQTEDRNRTNGGQPARDARGRFVSHKTSGQVAPERPAARPVQRNQAATPFATMSDEALIGIIQQNLWDGEIDTDNATREELILFLVNKEEQLRRLNENAGKERPHRPVPQRPMGGRPTATQKPESDKGSSGALNKFMAMLNKMAEEARNNPQLAETITRFMPQD